MFYGNATDFKSYHEARGRSIPLTLDDDSIEVALLVASEYLDDKYEGSYFGYKTDGWEQERSWPRISAMTNTDPQHIFTNQEIPTRVVHATYEAAYREALSSGALNVDFKPNKYNSVSVSGAISVDYAKNQDINDVQVQIAKIGTLIKPLLDPRKEGYHSSLTGGSERL